VGGLAGRAASGQSSLGEDLEQSARITFDEAFTGTTRRLHVVRLAVCAACGGTGDVAIGAQPCEACGGAGEVRSRRSRMIFTRPCAHCAASGVVAHRPCGRCGGEGRAMQSEWAEVEIPPGARDGGRIRLAGLGNAGRRGGPAGDCHLVVHVEPHPLYRQKDDDLHCEVPVTMVEAALGAHVEVPTPDGAVAIEIPAGTQTGQRFRLRKRGMPRPDGQGRGDLYVEARVFVPAVRDDESRDLLREFERRNRHDPRRNLGQAAPAGKAR
jgi:molecular chaperone DnaJ